MAYVIVATHENGRKSYYTGASQGWPEFVSIYGRERKRIRQYKTERGAEKQMGRISAMVKQLREEVHSGIYGEDTTYAVEKALEGQFI